MNNHIEDDPLSRQLKRATAELSRSTPLGSPSWQTRRPFHATSGRAAQTRLPRYAFGIGIAVALVIAVPFLTVGLLNGNSARYTQIHLPGLTITAKADSNVSPQLSSLQATAAALSFLQDANLNPSFAGYVVSTATFEPDVQNVVGQCASISLPSPGNYWVIEASAPAQQGWQTIHAIALVNDETATANTAEVLVGKAPPSSEAAGTASSCS